MITHGIRRLSTLLRRLAFQQSYYHNRYSFAFLEKRKYDALLNRELLWVKQFFF